MYFSGDVQSHICAEVEMGILEEALDPVRELAALVISVIPLVRKDHHSIV